jgi:hypothetical protein
MHEEAANELDAIERQRLRSGAAGAPRETAAAGTVGGRRGKKRAFVAPGHTNLVIV